MEMGSAHFRLRDLEKQRTHKTSGARKRTGWQPHSYRTPGESRSPELRITELARRILANREKNKQ
jgi:hypothetical protein